MWQWCSLTVGTWQTGLYWRSNVHNGQTPRLNDWAIWAMFAKHMLHLSKYNTYVHVHTFAMIVAMHARFVGMHGIWVSKRRGREREKERKKLQKGRGDTASQNTKGYKIPRWLQDRTIAAIYICRPSPSNQSFYRQIAGYQRGAGDHRVGQWWEGSWAYKLVIVP